MKAAIDIHKPMSMAVFQRDLASWAQFANPWAKLYPTISFLREIQKVGQTHLPILKTKQWQTLQEMLVDPRTSVEDVFFFTHFIRCKI